MFSSCLSSLVSKNKGEQMDIGKYYDVVYSRGYDIDYENGIKCIKKTPKSFRVERADGTTFLIPDGSIMELKKYRSLMIQTANK